MLRRLLLLVFMILAVGNADDLQKVSLQLKWKHQFQFAGYYMAKEKGFYKDVGLDVSIKELENGGDAEGELLSGRADFAVLSSHSLISVANKHSPIIYLDAIYQTSPFAIMTTKDKNITKVKDFAGKRLESKVSEYGDISLLAMMRSCGVEIANLQLLPPSFDVEDLINNKTDLMSVYISNEPYLLQEKGIEPILFKPSDYGFNYYNDLLSTTQEYLQKNRNKAVLFRGASLKGWEYAFNHIEESVDLILQKYNTQHKTRDALLYEARTLKKLAYKDTNKIGEFKLKRLYSMVDAYKLFGYIKADKKVDLSKNIYKDFVQISLSPEERLWILEHPVVTYSEVNWKPLSIIENDSMKGIMGEYLKIIEQKTGLTFHYVPSKSWPEVLQKFKDKKIDVVPGIGSSKGETSLGLVSEEYANYPMSIVTTHKYAYIDDLKHFNNKTLALPKYYTSYNYIKENYPKIKILPTKSIQEALMAVHSQKADGFVGHIAPALYYMSQLHLDDLKVSGVANFVFEHHYLIQKSDPVLLGIINKVIATITEKERQDIYSHWVKTEVVESGISLSTYLETFGILAIFMFILYYRKRELQKLKEQVERGLLGSDAVLFDYDLRTQRVYLSKQFGVILGDEEPQSEYCYDVESWIRLIEAEDRTKAQEKIKEHLKTKKGFVELVFGLRDKRGTLKWIELHGRVQKRGEKSYFSGTLRDVTVEKKLQNQLQLQSDILQQIHDSVIVTDLKGTIVEWNNGATRIFGYTKEEALGRNISFLTPKEVEDESKEMFEELYKEGSAEGEFERITKDKRRIFIFLKVSFLRDEQGEITNIIGYSHDITDKKEAQQELEQQQELLFYQARHDPLTNLPNRLLFEDRLTVAIEHAHRVQNHLALLFIDLDYFKEINDSLGHKIGDEVLKEISKRLLGIIRKEDTLARLGGDEFTVIMQNLKDPQDASILATKIIEEIKKPIPIEKHTLYLSSSIGISLYPENGLGIDELLKNADAAMYRAKSQGRSTFEFYSVEMTEKAFEKVLMEAGIREGVERDEFVVFFQPQVDARDERQLGMEALVRWEHPQMGLVSPVKFIPLAEATGLVVEIDRIVMRKAIQQIVQWYKESLNPGYVSLNLSVRHLRKADFLEFFIELLRESGCRYEWVELEVTESQIMQNPEESIKVLEALHNLGIRLSIDDFGTGYSSLSYLKRLPIDKLKIDRSFIKDIPQDKEDEAITKAIIALADTLNLDLIAEGADAKEQIDFLLQNGCHKIQGFYYSKPLSAELMTQRLHTFRV